MNSKTTTNDRTRQDLHLLYTTSVGDIRFAKQQQWRFTYYALLLMTGIFYLRSNTELHLCWHIALAATTLLIAVFAVWVIIRIEDDLLRYRSKMIEVENRLPNIFGNLSKTKEMEEKKRKILWECKTLKIKILRYKCEYLLIQISAIFVAAFFLVVIPFLDAP